MVPWRYTSLFVLVLLVLSVLFFIPSESTGFATQIESLPRMIIGFMLAFIVLIILAASLRKKKPVEQSFSQTSPTATEVEIIEKSKENP
ncbi:MAG TPA: hypothetical protein VJ343_02645 [archaeon]|nr:hypothetical protein [archaeon]